MKNKTHESSMMGILFALLIVSAKLVIPIPFYDYLSLQIVVVYLSYPLLGVKKALLVNSAYVLLGLAGLPIFAAGGGFAYLLRPTFGFLLAFALLPLVQHAIRNLPNLFLQNYLCLLFIHLVGFCYKYFILKVYLGQIEHLSVLLTVSVLLDFSSDCLLVFLATVLQYRLAKLGKLSLEANQKASN